MSLPNAHTHLAKKSLHYIFSDVAVAFDGHSDVA
jgi:hypothetical protein